VIISPDHFLIEPDGTYVWTRGRSQAAWVATIDRVRSLLAEPGFRGLVLLAGLPGAGKSTWLEAHQDPHLVYVDATFTRRAHRAPFLQIAANAEKPADAVLLDTPFEECLRRNNLRPTDRKVPPEKMVQFLNEISVDPPTLGEGFKTVTRVLP
jgi:predicted kinase